MTKHIILFLAANPLGTDRLALDEEARAIQEELERSGHRDRFELVTRWAVQPLDLLRELRKLKPTVVHFSGHGDCDGRGSSRLNEALSRDVVGDGEPGIDGGGDGQRGLYFQGSDGRPQLVSAAALEETFGAAGSSVKLVVLNACYSEVQAEALLAHVDCVAGMHGPISDVAARNFAIGFYGGLGECESVAAAYRQGCAAIILEGLVDGERPRLRARNGIDADQFVIAEARQETTNTRVDASQMRSILAAGVPSYRLCEDDATAKPAETIARAGRRRLALKFITGKYDGAVVPLPESGIIRIGRASGLEMELIDDRMSRLHAQILISDGVVTVSDSNSTNGTYINGARVVLATRLDVGDRILVGASIMKLFVATKSGPSLEAARARNEQFKGTDENGATTSTQWEPSEDTWSGILQDIPIEDILRLLCTSRRSGILSIIGHMDHMREIEIGHIDISKGNIINVKVSHSKKGREALFEMFTWRKGSFEFKPPAYGEPHRWDGAIDDGTDHLLTEALKVLTRS